jgi:(1->4)-alpha-D-glucan 1-alpha-D-glucosylmutase
MARVPVYRSYARPGYDTDDGRLAVLDEAIDAASAARPEDDALYRGIRDALRLALDEPGPARDFLRRLQQTTGMVMAKGVEDTAFYRYHRLVSLNEVGGDPAEFGVSVEAFHTHCAERQRLWPYAMTSLSTHDTKRSEDVRARIALLSEIPERWAETVRRWYAHNDRHRTDAGPDPNLEYLYYQTLVGAHPLAPDRALAYMEKAAHEAKERTSWVDPNADFDAALRAFVEATLTDADFTVEVDRFVAPLIEPARVTALSQKLICLTAPGVPDVYRGTELWDLSLVDPDNRRPVDFEARAVLLRDVDGLTPEAAMAGSDAGLPKLLVVARALQLRRRRPEAFGVGGGYRALEARGPRAAHLVGFGRGDAAVTLAPRLVLGLAGEWADTTVALPEGRWRDVLTGDCGDGGERNVAELLARFPVALLERA